MLEIDTLKFRYAENIEIESTWQELGDKCTISLPNKAVLKKNDTDTEELNLEKTFKTGMAVKVHLGYDNNNTLLFEGYISQIKPNLPLEIVCEDEIYKLKRSKKINKAFTGTLRGLLSMYFEQIEIDSNLPDVKLTNFILKEATQAEILKQLKDTYGLCAYFRGKKLYVGLQYFEVKGRHKFDFQKNVVSSNLEYKKEDDIRLKAKAISFLSNNTKIEAEVGDSDGEQKTFYFYGENDKNKLKILAENELKKLKFEGYRGSFEAFGVPVVAHGETVLLFDKRYAERNGQGYLVDKVKTSWGASGYRQIIEIARKV
jgi:hypothetical protein